MGKHRVRMHTSSVWLGLGCGELVQSDPRREYVNPDWVLYVRVGGGGGTTLACPRISSADCVGTWKASVIVAW